MTNEEAIRIISNYDVLPCGYCHQGGKEIEEAFNLAIEALKSTEEIIMRCEFLELCIESYGDKINRSKCDCEKCDHYDAFNEGKQISLDAAWDA